MIVHRLRDKQPEEPITIENFVIETIRSKVEPLTQVKPLELVYLRNHNTKNLDQKFAVDPFTRRRRRKEHALFMQMRLSR